MTDLRRSPLHDRHAALGAKFAPFGGWEMPLEYAGGGTLKEHAAVREAVGVFDVSHLGKVTVVGTDAVGFLNSCLTNDLARVGAGQAQYTLACSMEGGVVDDLIAYVDTPDSVFLVPNAANTAEIVQRLRAAAPEGVEINDVQGDYAVLAVQGPRSAELVAAIGLPVPDAYMSFVVTDRDGDVVWVCRSGYTGERGFELIVAAAGAGGVWDALLAAGADLGVRPAGLAARDTLRTEMGYPLHGQELSLSISPVQARAGWAVGWSKPSFWGREALLAERAEGPSRLLWGLLALDRGIPRGHMPVLAGGAEVGELTSGTFSPTLRVGIGLALIDTASGLGEGDEVEVDIRGRASRMRLVRPPFVESHVR